MSDTRKTMVCIMSSLALCAGARAIVADSPANPYQGIVDRNVFGLKPPPPPSKGTEPDKPPPPKITLTGITTIFHDKRALMTVAMPARPPEAAKQQSFILAEHQREGDIEVLEIDVKAGDVKVNNFGTVVTLNLEKDGAKLPSGPAPAPVMAGAQPSPGGGPGAVPGGSPAGMKAIPLRPIRTPETAATAAPAPVYASANTGSSPGFTGSPGFAGSPGYEASPVPAQPLAQQMSAEEHTILVEANHERAKAMGDPSAMLFPPTELNPTRNAGPGQTEVNQAPVGQIPQQQNPFNFQIPGNPTLPRLPQ